MIATQENEVWRQIPPEEKIQLMTRAQSSGVLSALTFIIVLVTVAVALELSWLIWCAIFASPIVYQFTASRCWRRLRPEMMLKYLAARSAARRYAFSNASKDLSIALIFRGMIEHQFDSDHIQERLEATIANTKTAEVWIALFRDTLIIMSESVGGAKLEFGCPHVKLSLQSDSDGGSYRAHRELLISAHGRMGAKQPNVLKLTSPYHAALVVFEKRLLQYRNEMLASETPLIEANPDLPDTEKQSWQF